MSTNNNFDQYDLFEEMEELSGKLPGIKNKPKERRRPRLKDRYHIIDEPEVIAALADQADDRRILDFTYKASKTEEAWLLVGEELEAAEKS